jgi:cytochrome P450
MIPGEVDPVGLWGAAWEVRSPEHFYGDAPHLRRSQLTQAPVFNPWLPETQADPYPSNAQLREQAPCFYIPEGGVWAVSRYQDVKAVSRDAARFTMAAGGSARPRPELKLYPAADPPEHTKTRRMVQPRFRRGTVNTWEERAEEIASRGDSQRPP